MKNNLNRADGLGIMLVFARCILSTQTLAPFCLQTRSFDLRAGFDSIKADYIRSFDQYTFDAPVVMPLEMALELRQLGLVIYKAIAYMLGHYQDYLRLLPRSEKELRILEICARHPFRVGSFRPDFVVSETGEIKVVEINARQPMNGQFSSGFFREIGLRQAEKWNIRGVVDFYPAFFDYLEAYIGSASHICVVQGSYVAHEIRMYPGLFEQAGIPCTIVPVAQLAQNLDLLRDAWVIEELMPADLDGLPLEVIEALAESNPHNALNANMIAGSKRFFCALNDAGFLSRALQPAEIALVKKFILPTIMDGNEDLVWERAFVHKDEFILKHHASGRSDAVYAGCLTPLAQWQAFFEPSARKEMVLQPFVRQKRFQGWVGDEPRNDYLTGMLLCFNQEFFGPGLYRTDSTPISTKGTFRKIAPLVAEVDEILPGVNYL